MEIEIISLIILPAIALGLLTSLHCVGMCGPIALSLGLGGGAGIKFVTKNLTYQLGRVTTYTLMGMLLGAIGQVSLGNFQQYLSIGLGVILIVLALFPRNLTTSGNKILQKPLLWLKRKLGALLGKKSYDSLFTIGLLNGLLPCGPVYVALAASLAIGSYWGGALFMAVFGLGTLPLMFLMVFLGNTISLSVRNKILRFFPYLTVLIGLLFILRGLGLGIPYISPPGGALDFHSGESCH